MNAPLLNGRALLKCTRPHVSDLAVFLCPIIRERWYDQVIKEGCTTPDMIPEGHERWKERRGVFVFRHESESRRHVKMSWQRQRDA